MTTASGVAPQVVSGTTPLPTKDASGASLTSTAGSTLAGNFQTFLTLLTTQLQNQNPLDPLDTNQFTQQLVQFAGVEQQLKQTEQLKALIAIEKSAQSTPTICTHLLVIGQHRQKTRVFSTIADQPSARRFRKRGSSKSLY